MDLKPCPFCEAPMRGNGNPFWQCSKCAANVHKSVWNTRPIEDALRARLAELESEKERRVAAQEAITNHWEPRVAELEARNTYEVNLSEARRLLNEELKKNVAELEAENSKLEHDNKRLRDKIAGMQQIVGTHDDPDAIAMELLRVKAENAELRKDRDHFERAWMESTRLYHETMAQRDELRVDRDRLEKWDRLERLHQAGPWCDVARVDGEYIHIWCIRGGRWFPTIREAIDAAEER